MPEEMYDGTVSGPYPDHGDARDMQKVVPHQARFALVIKPDTPPRIARELLSHLYPFELLKLCLLPRVSADIRFAAEKILSRKIPSQPLGNKLSLARQGTAVILDALLRDGVPSVMKICLDNPRLKEGSLHQFLRSFPATEEMISQIASHNRWKGRPEIRLAILKNPNTPACWFTSFLPELSPTLLEDLLISSRLTGDQKELVRQARSGTSQ